MLRREVLGHGAALGGFAMAGCVGDADDLEFREGFEAGIGEWESGAAIGPEVDLAEFEWELEISEAEAAEGEHSLRIWNEGDYDDGVTWGVHPMPVEPEQAYEIEVSAQFWSESESFNTLRDAVMRLAPEPPAAEADFPHPGVNSTDMGVTPYGGLREPLWVKDGWRAYSFDWTTPEVTTDRLYIALGTSVIWEGDATHFIDNVHVEFSPQ